MNSIACNEEGHFYNPPIDADVAVRWASPRAAPNTSWDVVVFSDSAGGYQGQTIWSGPTGHQEKTLNTAQFARELGIQPESLRKSVAKNGSYFGVVPTKTLNGRLIWPAAELERLKGGAK